VHDRKELSDLRDRVKKIEAPHGLIIRLMGRRARD
jgi:hypothetical protein